MEELIDKELINNNEEFVIDDSAPGSEISDIDKLSAEIVETRTKLAEINDSYVRLMADFDNYRKRTLKEKSELIKTGSETALINLLPVIDDMDRALKAFSMSDQANPFFEGVELIYQKFLVYLTAQGIKEIVTLEAPFDTEFHEAITLIPAPCEELKGKIIDCIQKGYTLNDKVIRFAKVVVGE